MNIQKRLLEQKCDFYRQFQANLMPTVDESKIIGVRSPFLRKLAKELVKNGEYRDFLCDLPHKYYEENNLHAYIIAQIKNFDECIEHIERFLPYVDNWATCDILRPFVFRTHKKELVGHIEGWLESEHTYTVRFAIEALMLLYIDDDECEQYIKRVSEIKSDEYYVNMMIAWFFVTALAIRWDEALPYINEKRLDEWVRCKAIQKAVESRRISDTQKEYLKTLR
ncbi:MAG: DNA alkylation repair protein [Clostridia bacterium]|nr:DNA alkylation repair protein [Clostridia bacterium]